MTKRLHPFAIVLSALCTFVFLTNPVAADERPLRIVPQTRPAAAAPAAAPSFDGTWRTTYGRMTLKQTGDAVDGTYGAGTFGGGIKGKVAGKKLTFDYTEPGVTGVGWFELNAAGDAFAGKWHEDANEDWKDWVGQRIDPNAPAAPPGAALDLAEIIPPAAPPAAAAPTDFSGLWQTTYGRMRLRQVGTKVTGTYSWSGVATIEGEVGQDGKVFTFKYSQPDGESGTGKYELAAGAGSFSGTWTGGKGGAAGGGGGSWTGTRIKPEPGRIWLIILEVPWEHDIAENEYSYGLMLRTFFARVPKVQVRHRFIHDEADLRRWVADAAYLAEPVVLYFSSHGTGEGLSVGGKSVGADVLADCLKARSDLLLLHFGACLVCSGNVPAEIHKKLGDGATFPISGFKHSADWAGSALVDFAYLELIFSRGMSPDAAATEVRKMMTFANDKGSGAIAPMGLTVINPPAPKAAKPPAAAARTK